MDKPIFQLLGSLYSEPTVAAALTIAVHSLCFIFVSERRSSECFSV